MDKLIFIKHRYKIKQVEKRTPNEVHEEIGDWIVDLDNLEKAKQDILLHVKKMFTDQDGKLIESNNHKADLLFQYIDEIQDDQSLEKFVIHLINYSGVLLKFHCKIFFKDNEYFYFDFKIWKSKYSPKIFIRKNLEKDCEVVWTRPVFQKRTPYNNYNKFSSPSEPLKINTYGEFYSYYADKKKKHNN